MLARKKHYKNLEYNLPKINNQLPQKVKSAQYKIIDYKIGLEEKSSYIYKFKDRCKQKDLEKLLCLYQNLKKMYLIWAVK